MQLRLNYLNLVSTVVCLPLSKNVVVRLDSSTSSMTFMRPAQQPPYSNSIEMRLVDEHELMDFPILPYPYLVSSAAWLSSLEGCAGKS